MFLLNRTHIQRGIVGKSGLNLLAENWFIQLLPDPLPAVNIYIPTQELMLYPYSPNSSYSKLALTPALTAYNAAAQSPAALSALITDLLTHTYLNGYAISVNHWRDGRRRSENWQGAIGVIVDIDDCPLPMETLVTLPTISRAAAIYPSSSHTPAEPRYHVLYLFDRACINPDEHRATYQYLAGQIALETGYPVDSAASDKARSFSGTVFTRWQNAPEKALSDCYINPSTIGLIAPAPPRRRAAADQPTSAGDDGNWESALAHLCAAGGHLPYDQWRNMWMAAHAASNGSARARDMIINGNFYWRDADAGRRSFERQWDKHQSRAITSRTLYRYALDAGWKPAPTSPTSRAGCRPTWTPAAQAADQPRAMPSRTPAEGDAEPDASPTLSTAAAAIASKVSIPYPYGLLDTSRAIRAADLESLKWDEMNRLALVVAPTGMGKTKWAIAQAAAADLPTVFFAPTVNLCRNLHNRLCAADLDASLYLDENGQRVSISDYANARVMVTTFQSFLAFFEEHGLGHYRRFIIDESDQIIAAAARQGIYTGASHMKRNQALGAIDIFNAIAAQPDAALVMLDATATRLSQTIIPGIQTYLVGSAADQGIIRRYTNWGHFEDQVVTALTSRAEGLIVIGCDTAARAGRYYKMALECGKTALLISKHTKNLPATREFMDAPDQAAALYDVIVYSPVMGSGVSIEGIAPAKLFIHASYLNAPAIIQLMARFRQRPTIQLFMRQYHAPTSRAAEARAKLNTRKQFSRSADQLTAKQYQLACIAIDQDAALDADRVAAFDVLATHAGYTIEIDESESISATTIMLAKRLKALRDEEQGWIYDNWPSIAPIDPDSNEITDLPMIEILAGQFHHRINETFPIWRDFPDVTPRQWITDMLKNAAALYDLRRALSPDRLIASAIYDASRNQHQRKFAMEKVRLLAALVSLLNDDYQCDENAGRLILEAHPDEIAAFLPKAADFYNNKPHVLIRDIARAFGIEVELDKNSRFKSGKMDAETKRYTSELTGQHLITLMPAMALIGIRAMGKRIEGQFGEIVINAIPDDVSLRDVIAAKATAALVALLTPTDKAALVDMVDNGAMPAAALVDLIDRLDRRQAA